MATLRIGALIAALAAVLGALAWCAVSDLRRFTIPNRACALVAGGYLLAGVGMTPGGWWAGLVVGALVLVAGFGLFARGWVGGGDVKLAAAAGLWAGPGLFSSFMLVTSISAALLALLMLSPLRRALPGVGAEAATGFKQPMPFGAPLALGGGCAAMLRMLPLLGGPSW